MTPQRVLSVNGLGFSYGKRSIFENLNIEVMAGEILGILGPNGAGKTTLIKCLVGDLRPTTGTVHIGDLDVTRWSLWRRARRGLGYLTQGVALIPELNVLDNVRLGIRASQSRQRAETALSTLELAHLKTAHPDDLSGGERRQVELARLFAADQHLMILDEPYAALDPKVRQRISQILTFFQHQGRTIVVTDHDVLTTLELVSRAIVLVDGKICCEGNQAKILQDTFVRAHYLGDDGTTDGTLLPDREIDGT